MTPKRDLQNRSRADARKVNLHKSKSQERFHWTPAVWLQLIEAVEQFDNQKRTNWDVVAETLPPDFIKTFASVALAANAARVHFTEFRWQVKNPEKKIRFSTGVTDKVVQKMKDFERSRKPVNKSPPNPTRKHNRQKAAWLHGVKSNRPHRSSRRGKVDRVVGSAAFETFSTTSDTGQEMSVDQQEGFPADGQENSKMVAGRGLDNEEDSQSCHTAPQSFNEDPSDFESFFAQYDLVLNQIFCPMNIQNLIQNGKNRIREKMKQEFGNQKFKALLEPSSWSKSRASRDANFFPLQTRIIREVESGTDALFDKVAKDLAIDELQRKEE